MPKEGLSIQTIRFPQKKHPDNPVLHSGIVGKYPFLYDRFFLESSAVFLMMDRTKRGAAMPVESLLTMDLLMNLSILCAVQSGLGRLHMPSLLRALMLMCTNTLIAYFILPAWSSMLIQLPVCLVCGALLMRSTRPLPVFTAALAIFCASCAAAGLMSMGRPAPVRALAALIPFSLLVRKRRNIACRWNIEIIAQKQYISERFEALIDTGNRLTEHRSALPVMIVEESAVPRLSAMLSTLDPDELRTLDFGVLGSEGQILCFQPDKLFMRTPDGKTVPAPRCWIAVFRGRIPGRTRALAPPEFAEYTQNQTSAEQTIIDLIRRIPHVVFNRSPDHLRTRGTNQARKRVLHRWKRPSSASSDP